MGNFCWFMHHVFILDLLESFNSLSQSNSSVILMNNGSGNGLLSAGTKPLPEPADLAVYHKIPRNRFQFISAEIFLILIIKMYLTLYFQSTIPLPSELYFCMSPPVSPLFPCFQAIAVTANMTDVQKQAQEEAELAVNNRACQPSGHCWD